MKYLAILILSFVFFSPVLAAKTVQGTVPKVSPLQPAPAGVFPNLKNNAEFHDASHSFSTSTNGEGTVVNQAPTLTASGAPIQAAAKSSGGKSGYVIWVLLILVLAGVLWLWFKNRKPEEDV
jgi:hypothetical protein